MVEMALLLAGFLTELEHEDNHAPSFTGTAFRGRFTR